jgi:hypothetical protein
MVHEPTGSQDSSVGIVTRPCAGAQRNLGSIRGRGKIFLFSVTFRLTIGPTQPPTWGSFLGCKVVEHEADCSLAPDAEVKNGGPRPPFPHTSSLCGA